MPPGFCNPPVCWDLQYNFANIRLIVIRPKDVPKWNKGAVLPPNQFADLVAAFQNKWNGLAKLACGPNCVCVKLHPKRITVRYAPQRIGPHPGGKTDIYMDGITATGWFGVCAMKGWIKIKKGNKWIPVEDLKEPDIIKFKSSSGSGKKKSKKGKKKASRRSPR